MDTIVLCITCRSYALHLLLAAHSTAVLSYGFHHAFQHAFQHAFFVHAVFVLHCSKLGAAMAHGTCILHQLEPIATLMDVLAPRYRHLQDLSGHVPKTQPYAPPGCQTALVTLLCTPSLHPLRLKESKRSLRAPPTHCAAAPHQLPRRCLTWLHCLCLVVFASPHLYPTMHPSIAPPPSHHHFEIHRAPKQRHLHASVWSLASLESY